MEFWLRDLKLADLLLALLFSGLGAWYVRNRSSGLNREAEERRATELRNYIADQDRMLAGLRADQQQLETRLTLLKCSLQARERELTDCLRECFSRQAYIRVLVRLLQAAGIPAPERLDP